MIAVVVYLVSTGTNKPGATERRRENMPSSVLSPPPTPSRIPIPRSAVQTPPGSPTKAGGIAWSSSRDVRMNTAQSYGILGRDVLMQTAKVWGDEDVRMETARGFPDTYVRRPPPLKLWERELLESPEVRRKATVAQLCKPLLSILHVRNVLCGSCTTLNCIGNDCNWDTRQNTFFVSNARHAIMRCPLTKLRLDFLDYYFQLVGYLKNRKERRSLFDADTNTREVVI